MSNTIDHHRVVPGSEPRVSTVRTVPMTLDQVWDAWTTPGGLQSWWWSEDPEVTYAVEPRVGGRYRIHSATTGLGVRGTFLTVDRPRQLRLQWRWLREYGPSQGDLVQVSFAVDEGEVVVRLEHTMAAGAATERWDDVLDSLARGPGALQPLVRSRCGCPVDGDPPVCVRPDCPLSMRTHWARDEIVVPLSTTDAIRAVLLDLQHTGARSSV